MDQQEKDRRHAREKNRSIDQEFFPRHVFCDQEEKKIKRDQRDKFERLIARQEGTGEKYAGENPVKPFLPTNPAGKKIDQQTAEKEINHIPLYLNRQLDHGGIQSRQQR